MHGKGDGGIEVSGLTYRSGNITILDDVSLHVPPGTLMGVLGSSGSGKSSLLKAINGLIVDIQGEVLVEGENIYRYSVEEMLSYHRRCGFVFQNAAMINNQTLIDNLTLAYRYNTDMDMAEIMDNLERYFEFFQIPYHILNDRPGVHALGVRMIFCIIRAMAKEASFYFWDEPLAHLDSIMKKKVMRVIQRFKFQKKTMLIASNDIHYLLSVFDRVAVMDRGSVVFCGTPAQVKRARNKNVKRLLRGEEE